MQRNGKHYNMLAQTKHRHAESWTASTATLVCFFLGRLCFLLLFIFWGGWQRRARCLLPLAVLGQAASHGPHGTLPCGPRDPPSGVALGLSRGEWSPCVGLGSGPGPRAARVDINGIATRLTAAFNSQAVEGWGEASVCFGLYLFVFVGR